MGKLIIDNRSSLSEAEIMRYASRVVDGGKVSGIYSGKPQYCYVMVWGHPKTNGKLLCHSYLNNKSDRLMFMDGE